MFNSRKPIENGLASMLRRDHKAFEGITGATLDQQLERYIDYWQYISPLESVSLELCHLNIDMSS
jgi:hypothetical protein